MLVNNWNLKTYGRDEIKTIKSLFIEQKLYLMSQLLQKYVSSKDANKNAIYLLDDIFTTLFVVTIYLNLEPFDSYGLKLYCN